MMQSQKRWRRAGLRRSSNTRGDGSRPRPASGGAGEVAGAEAGESWSNGNVAAEHAIRGFHAVTLKLDEASSTGAILRGAHTPQPIQYWKDVRRLRPMSLIRIDFRVGNHPVLIDNEP